MPAIPAGEAKLPFDPAAIRGRLANGLDFYILENWRPEVAGRLGLGHEELCADNPGLIYVSINGFGPSGPYAEQPAYDMLIQAWREGRAR